MKFILTLALSILITSSALAEVVIISGIYQGKDLYVKNPMTADGGGYCVYSVLVNGQETKDQLNSASFAVDLATWQLKIGDPLEIVLRCKENCEVKILNPEVIYPSSTFNVTACTISPTGALEWKTEKESTPLNFVIEQFRWNKWMKVGEVKGKGKPEECTYNFPVNLHSGTNTIRIYQMDYKGQHTSSEYKVVSATSEVKIKSPKISNSIDKIC